MAEKLLSIAEHVDEFLHSYFNWCRPVWAWFCNWLDKQYWK